MPDELRELAAARVELAELAADRQGRMLEVARRRAALATLERQGASPPERRRAARRLETVERAATRLDARAAELRDRVDRLRGRIRLATPETSVELLDGQVPVALFPVRLETRFVDDDRQLRVRIYPEQIHVDAHEPELTEAELRLAAAYWEARWASTSPEHATAAWRELTRHVRPARARWLLDVTEPANLDEIGTGTPEFPDDIALRAGPFTRQPTARLLPEQWVAIGFRGDIEVFRQWSRPVAEDIAIGLPPSFDVQDDTEVPNDQDTLAIDESIAWLVDYEAALVSGMAITVTDDDLDSGRLRDGVDELVVLGVDWGADPDAAAASIDAQLHRHAVSDGLAVLGPGVPTNNTADVSAAPGTDPILDGADFDPVTVVTAPGAATRLGRALGVDAEHALADSPARGSLDDELAADMNNVLWASTLGAFLDQLMTPVVSSRVADDVHDHFRRYVRGQGPYAAVRIGRQPYGVLPVAAGEVRTGDDFVDQLARTLSGFRPLWAEAVGRVPRLGDSDQPDVDVLELLRRTPRSTAFRFREAFGSSVSSSILGVAPAAVFQELLSIFLLALAGIPGRPRLSGVTLAPEHRDVPVPLVEYRELSETDPLDPDYVAAVLAASSTAGGFKRLLSEPGEARTLLEALLRQSAATEYVIGSTLLVLDHELSTHAIEQAPPTVRVLEREVLGITADEVVGPGPDAPVSRLATAKSPIEIADARIREIAGSRTLANHLAVTPNSDLRRRAVTRRFATFRSSLGRLVGLPTAELDRLASSTLDCISHRLDAWITSVASRRLDALRDERGSGTYIGGFGYVEDLRPSTGPVSRGYLHAPSVAHATTAAILRSGHLARGDSPDGALTVDLRSTRVARAVELLDGVRRGQPIGALLGHRFERSVRDRRLTLAKYILPIRQRTPLPEVSTGPEGDTAVESIAARDVVDGVALLDAWRPDPAAYYDSLPVDVPSADRADLDELLDQLDDAFDAVSDVLVAESVHQAVMGNAERSAAAVDALDRQQALPDIGVIRTPRSATGLEHRVLVLFDSDGPAPGWTTEDPRRAADPRVDTWCGTVLGDPARFRFAAEVRDADGAVLESLQARHDDLSLSALSTVTACAAAGTDATELEQRLALHFGGLVTADGATEIVLLDDPPAGSGTTAIGLRDLLELGDQVGALLASARHADARALLPDTERPGANVDVAELRARADVGVAALAGAVAALEALPDDADTDQVVAALLAAGDAGVAGAVPGAEPPGDHAARIAAAGRRTLDGIAAQTAAFAEGAPEAAAQAAHELARLRTVFGESFPAVARFSLPGPATPEDDDFRASLAASAADAALLGDDMLAPSSWLALHAPVRPAVRRLVDALEGSEMLGGRGGLADLHVVQLPHRPGAAWIARPFSEPPPPTTSWVLHSSTPPSFGEVMAGVIIDQWTEAIPSTSETTGVSFHFDAPGARAPQTVLIATPTARDAEHWSVGTLASAVRDAFLLARIRPLDIDDVDAAARFVPAAYLPFNLEAKVPSINLPAIISTAITVHNARFLEIDS